MEHHAIHFMTPAVTPLCPDGQLDLESCGRLYEHLIQNGVDGILVLGSIGEFYALTMEQKKEMIRFAVATVNHRAQVIIGTASMVLEEVISLSNFALEEGADAVMVVPPYYFHYTDASVFDYYDKLAEAIPGKLYLYNFPDRTGYEISPAVAKALAEKHANIVGIKDSVQSFDHTRELIKQVRTVRPDFLVYSGYDDSFVHNILSGGNGCIGGLSNIRPALTSSWVQAAKDRDWDRAEAIQHTVDQLMDIYYVGKPFVPYIKQAVAMEGIIRYNASSFPMPVPTEEETAKLAQILAPTKP